MPRDFKRDRDRKFHRPNVAEEAYNDNKYVPPEPEKVTADSETLHKKAFRDLDNMRVIDVHADPNAELSYGSFPYTVIGRTNPVLDANYPGYENIAGNTITLIQNDTTKSQLMNLFDVGVIVKKLNYLYLPIKSNALNKAVAGEMIKNIEQAVSFGFSTMLTQLPFATATYVSDLPIPTAQVGSKAAGYYSCLIHYQTVLQNLVRPVSNYIELRSLEKEMMRMSFRTEAPLITQLFGLFKKSSFVSEVNTIGSVVLNEYLDDNWYRQMNTLLCVPSRKTKGMVDPLLTLVGVHNIPSLTINGTEYDSSKLKTGDTSKLLDPETFKLVEGSKSLEQLILDACKLMNPAYIFRFVRLLNHNGLAADAIHTISAYGEGVKQHLAYIATLAASFSTAMSNVRTFLDKLSQSGMVYWKKGISFFVDKIVQLEPTYNVLLADVFKANYSGADKIIFDSDTKRWRAWAFWNKYEGVPQYDKVSGGCFLTFGLRDIQSTDSAGQAVDFESSTGLIPVLFSPETSSMVVTRMGASSPITYESIDNAALAADHYLVRLNTLANTNLSVKQPIITTYYSNANERARFCSAALLFLSNVFGYGATKYNNNIVDRSIDPDYVAFVDMEIEDVSNQMIVFACNYSPFRVSTPNPSRTIGFKRT